MSALPMPWISSGSARMLLHRHARDERARTDPGTPSGCACRSSCSCVALAAPSTSIGPSPSSKTTAPASGVTARMMILLTVVLPQPLSPTSPRHSPRRMSKLTSSTARARCCRRPPPNQPDLRVEKVLRQVAHRQQRIGAVAAAWRRARAAEQRCRRRPAISRSGFSRSPGFMSKRGTAGSSALR